MVMAKFRLPFLFPNTRLGFEDGAAAGCSNKNPSMMSMKPSSSDPSIQIMPTLDPRACICGSRNTHLVRTRPQLPDASFNLKRNNSPKMPISMNDDARERQLGWQACLSDTRSETDEHMSLS